VFGGRGRQMGAVGCAVVATALTAACSGRSPEGGRSPAVTTAVVAPTTHSTTASPLTTAPAPSTNVRSVAVEVYLAMWADMVEAGQTADFQSPKLADHAASQALLLLSGSLRSAHEKNLVIKGQPALTPRAIGVTPASSPVAVSIVDCVDDTQWLNYTQDGRLQNTTPGGKHRTTATVGLLNRRWMVTRLQIGEVGTCT
jgi:hypothetical protein